ncbi:MAG: FKBP-type peptidyl-prolyl cis-trans isomerase [Elusimicrobiales bacterium]
MKKISTFMMVIFLSTALVSSQDKKDIKDVRSSAYMLGVAMTRNISAYDFSKQEIDDMIKGFSDGLRNKPDYRNTVDYNKVNEMIKAKKNELMKKNKKKGEEYLKKLSSQPNAAVIDNGIVYVRTTEGKGASPSENDTVKVHYSGKLIDGKEFDSSYKKNQPAEFKLNSVIPCWTKAITKMKIGEKATIGCPSDTAYGDNGIEMVIPPGSTLIFDVELLDIVKENKADNIANDTVKKEDK